MICAGKPPSNQVRQSRNSPPEETIGRKVRSAQASAEDPARLRGRLRVRLRSDHRQASAWRGFNDARFSLRHRVQDRPAEGVAQPDGLCHQCGRRTEAVQPSSRRHSVSGQHAPRVAVRVCPAQWAVETRLCRRCRLQRACRACCREPKRELRSSLQRRLRCRRRLRYNLGRGRAPRMDAVVGQIIQLSQFAAEPAR